MPLAGLLLLQAAAIGGLVLGRRPLLLVIAVAAVPAGAVLAGTEGGVLALLALAGLGLGAHLHELVRDHARSKDR